MQFSWRSSLFIAASLLFSACECAEAAKGTAVPDEGRIRDWVEQYNEDFYVETLGLSTVFLEEFCTESLTVSMS